MGRRKKPGTPGKKTIPREIVSAVTKRIQSEFKRRGCDDYLDVFVIAQQCYIYVETHPKQRDLFGGPPPPKPRVTTSSTTHHPRGRLRYLGNAERWELQPYRWSDELWDDEEGLEFGTLDELLDSILFRV
jgi:hypothetical protein